MSQVKQLLDSLLWDIYGKQQQTHQRKRLRRTSQRQRQINKLPILPARNLEFSYTNPRALKRLSVRKLIDYCAILKVEIRLMSYFLENVLISRDRSRRHQEILCGFVDAVLHLEYHDAHPKMRFSLSPPPPKASTITSTASIIIKSPTNMHARTSATATAYNDQRAFTGSGKSDEEASTNAAVIINNNTTTTTTTMSDDTASDYNQWLHAMKLVARLPGGMPPEFRRKLWLSLADKYLKLKNVDWAKEEEKCFCEKWREDDEELGIQIVKDLHRTGSNLCTGPAGSINQAKLKRILLGYARYNPEVGYCQGFNMLGALILQVMEKEEAESMKVMIYLVEGVLPPGYFCGSMGGLQADMGVFRDLMQTKLPRLAKHLQKLQGPIENAYEPPLTNVFTMQWFLTMFCTCLPMSCVLRVWDLVLIEGSDVLLRTALVLWSLLEERVLSARTADDFYGKMGSFSSELLNGHLIDSNGLIEKVVQLGPIPDIQKLRDKHLYNITPLRHKQGLQLYFDDEEPESDEESRLAVATVWGLPWGRRGSHGQSSNTNKQTVENKDRIALDISLLKKQYDRLRERQKQAHIILTTACSTARQGTTTSNQSNQPLAVNQLLLGRPAIITNKGRRVGPPPGAIPPARKPSLPAILHTKPAEKQLRRGETLHWRDTDMNKRRRDSLSWKEIKADRAQMIREGSVSDSSVQPQKLRSRVGKSDSSSYSDESDDDNDDVENGSSTDTSLCDEDDPNSTGDRQHHSSSIEHSPKRKSKLRRKQKELPAKLLSLAESRDSSKERIRPKSWAPSNNEIPFMLMSSPVHSGDDELTKEDEDSATECDRISAYKRVSDMNWPSDTKYSPIAGDLASTKLGPLHVQTDVLTLPVITSTSQLSPMPDITTYLNSSIISPLPTPKPLFLDSTNSLGSGDGDGDPKKFDVSDDGVINQYFERVNSVERPTKLDLFYSLNEEDSIRNAYEESEPKVVEEHKTEDAKPENNASTTAECDDTKITENVTSNADDADEPSVDRRMELLMDYSEKSSAAYIAEATNELSTSLGKEKLKDNDEQSVLRDNNIPGANRDDYEEELKTTTKPVRRPALQIDKKHTLREKRRDPRRLTLTKSSTIDIEQRFEAMERQLSNENFLKKDENKREECNNDKENTKRIPSTVDLEERYNTFDRQLSMNKSNRKESFEFSKELNKISTNSDCDSEPTRNPCRIPSTADLESRFNALERQLSSHSLTTKNSIDLTNKGKNESDDKRDSANTSKQDSKQDIEQQETKVDTEIESTKEPTADASEAERPRLKKLPSTAELEDRFNALERKKSVQKSSPVKAKKEPPDDDKGENKSETQKKTQLDTIAGSIKEIKNDSKKESRYADNVKKEQEEPKKTLVNTETEAKIEESKESPKNKDVQETENAQISEGYQKKQDVQDATNAQKTKESSNDKESQEANNAQDIKETTNQNINGKKETDTSAKHEDEKRQPAPEDNEKANKKAPPSTEELERRFNVLEKQLSSANLKTESKRKDSLNKSSAELIANKKALNDSITESKTPDKGENKRTTKSFEEKCKAVNKKLSEDPAESISKQDLPAQFEENKKVPKSFEDKCKAVNEKLSEEQSQAEISIKNDPLPQTEESKRVAKSFEDKCKAVNEKLSEEQSKTASKTKPDSPSHAEETKSKANNDKLLTENEISKVEKDESRKLELESDKKQCDMPKRRASEPPSTEDLEKRFESLKRRMSSKPITERILSKSETVEEALERIEKEVIEEISEADDINERHSKESIEAKSEADAAIPKRKSSEPPSTEDLESRYEALQRSSSSKIENDVAKREDKLKEGSTTDVKEENKRSTSTAVEKSRMEENTSNDAHASIPAAPPMPKTTDKTAFSLIIDPHKQQQRRALIEEFQSKIKVQPNDANLRPSDINPNRKPPPSVTVPKNVDATSETHANTAFYRSDNYEPWRCMQSKKMVRRFSDLLSRADLENRLEFLEKQLMTKIYKQRCASDSEVTSRRYFIEAHSSKYGKDDDDNTPSTSASAQRSADDLEKRVQALEKQLSENSLKLLEAVRKNAEKVAITESDSPRRLSTETIDATGKELVRYTHYGELAETETHKPINISINIKMVLNKDVDNKKKNTESLPTTEQLDERLELLEKQLKTSKAEPNFNGDNEDIEANSKTAESVENLRYEAKPELDAGTENDSTKTKKEATPIATEKSKKDILNEESKVDNRVEVEIKTKEQVQADNENPAKVDVQKKFTKEDKTIENQEILRAKNTKDEHSTPETNNHKEIKEHEPEHPKESQEYRKSEIKTTVEKVVTSKKENKLDQNETNTQHQNKGSEENSEVSQRETEISRKTHETTEAISLSNEMPENVVINAADVGPIDPKNKTLVLLLDNEPKAVKVRRLTRANTEELEGLFQALEKQLCDRNLIKSEDGKLRRAESNESAEGQKRTEESKAITNLTKEIEEFTSAEKAEKVVQKPKEEEYDWGPDPVKRHLKRKTVHLPSTKELEARFRSLERQIKLLEDVENIDVEYRLNEIERKIKLQYSLSHEKDLSKFLELCEGKGLDDIPVSTPTTKEKSSSGGSRHSSPGRKSPYTSPSRMQGKTGYATPTSTQERKSPYTSPSRATSTRSPYTSPTRTQDHKSPYISPSRAGKRSPYTSPARQRTHDDEDDDIPSTENLEYRYRALDLKRSKSKENLDSKSKKKSDSRKQPIHPLEMLLDSSPDGSDIPTTGELEHRMRVLNEKRITPSPPQRSTRVRSPTIDDMKRQKLVEDRKPRTPIHNLETMVSSPTKHEPPTVDELDARMKALEQDQKFDFKMQKNFKEFNQKLKDVISPSLSFEEFKASRSREESPRRSADAHRSTTPKSVLRDTEHASRYEESSHHHYRSTSPKVLRFREEDEEYSSRPKSRTSQRDYSERMVGNSNGVLDIIEENSKMLHRILKKTLADSSSSSSISGALAAAATAEGLDAMGSRLMRETSPLQRTGTHTGVPLRTNDNINERLTSIKNTIKSIDTLCEEKPYRKEKCQRYIDSLFADSVHFSSKKTSLEDLRGSDGRREYTPSIRVSDHSQRPSEYYVSRSTMGSAESIRATSPLRAASPLHHRSQRDLRREVSPRGARRRIDEEREEYESRVRRENLLPNFHFFDNHSELSSGSSLIKFHKVDRQLDTYNTYYDERDRSSSRSASRSPLKSPYGSREMMMHHSNNTTTANTSTTATTKSLNTNILDLDRPVSPYRQTSHNLLGSVYDSTTHQRSNNSITNTNTPVYSPAKLEIRHTTVTSTFYDRLLTEKQIEKQLSRPSSKSPVISPSITSKSYLDLPVASANNLNNSKTSNQNSPTYTAQMHSILGTTGVLGVESKYASNTSNVIAIPNYINSIYNTGIQQQQQQPTTTSYNITTTNTTLQQQQQNYSNTGNSSTYQTTALHLWPPIMVANASCSSSSSSTVTSTTTSSSNFEDLRIRSCDNILMQLKSTSTNTAGSGSGSYAGYTITSAPTANTTTASITGTTPSSLLLSSSSAFTTTNTASSFVTTTTTISTTNLITASINTTATTTAINNKNNLANLGNSLTNFSSNLSSISIANIIPITSTYSNSNFNSSSNLNSSFTNSSYNYTTTALNMPLTIRQPSDISGAISLGLFTSNLNNNNSHTNNISSSSPSSVVTHINSATELPKS